MILLDNSYFVGELSLPNIPVTSPEVQEISGVAAVLQAVGEKNLNWFGDKYVVDFLVHLFGWKLATKFLTEIQKPEPDEIWVDLKSHLLLEFGSVKKSPIANYVYFWIMRDAMTKTTIAGEADERFNNADNVNARRKFVKAWNDMVDMLGGFVSWYYQNTDTYREYADNDTMCNPLSMREDSIYYKINDCNL
ncbi:MAG: hypothetical protein LBS54_04130 [Dysgonamonadaceae bacterium]|jgi:hypothetical protein|nr:hypothetical protein [Dysgonamonadaceae bacterium]